MLMEIEKIELSKRLQKAAELVKPNEKLLDIGSDHAYLPIYLVEENIVPEAIAGEVTQLPYENAMEQVRIHGLTEKISTRLGSGFDVLADGEEVGTAVICGMGGALIADIIEKGMQDYKIGENTRLILQPNNNQSALRKLLMEQQFKIDDEVIVKENRKYNEIIVASRSPEVVHYSEEDLIFGPVFLAKKPEEFLEKWQVRYDHNQTILEKLDQEKHQEKVRELSRVAKQIGKVIQ